jgi:hypothetical protein
MLQQIANVLTAALITAGASSLQAQIPKQIQIEVPFDFTVGQKSYQAGEYLVDQAMPSLLKLRNTSTNAAAFVLTNSVIEPGHKKSTPRLVFNRYGDKYFLSQVWPGSNSIGHQLSKSAAEREQMAKIASPSMVEVATRARTR